MSNNNRPFNRRLLVVLACSFAAWILFGLVSGFASSGFAFVTGMISFVSAGVTLQTTAKILNKHNPDGKRSLKLMVIATAFCGGLFALTINSDFVALAMASSLMVLVALSILLIIIGLHIHDWVSDGEDE